MLIKIKYITGSLMSHSTLITEKYNLSIFIIKPSMKKIIISMHEYLYKIIKYKKMKQNVVCDIP